MFVVAYYFISGSGLLRGQGESSCVEGYYFLDRKDAEDYIEDQLITKLLKQISDEDRASEILTHVDREAKDDPCWYCSLLSKGRDCYEADIFIYQLELFQKPVDFSFQK